MTVRRPAPRTLAGAAAGVVSAGVALGVGELVAAVVRPSSSPLIVVGNRVVLASPEFVKRWAIRTFGTSDKFVLISGIFVVVAVLTAVVGAVAVRRHWVGYAGVGLFTLFGCYCALTTAAHHGSDIIPTLVGGVAAALVLRELLRVITDPGDDESDSELPRRRSVLTGLGVGAAFALAGGYIGRVLQYARFNVEQARDAVVLPRPVSPAPALPAGTDLGRSPVPWLTPNDGFYRIDTQLQVPQVDPDDWRLHIHGMVDREITLTYKELLALPMIERWITLCCVSNEIGGTLVGTARFLGTPLTAVLQRAGVHADADQLLMTGVEGTTIGAPRAVVMDGRDAMIAVGMNGDPLPTAHGFPARIVVPGLYGYVSACKWVVDIEATTFAQKAYWVQGGWAPQPPIQLMSRMDTPTSGQVLDVGKPVVFAGVAWDQHVGVSAVEVQIDDRPWQPARLAAVPSTDTWRQWVYPWTPTAADAGHRMLRVRAVDARGQVQTAERADTYPSGATGYHTVSVTVR